MLCWAYYRADVPNHPVFSRIVPPTHLAARRRTPPPPPMRCLDSSTTSLRAFAPGGAHPGRLTPTSMRCWCASSVTGSVATARPHKTGSAGYVTPCCPAPSHSSTTNTPAPGPSTPSLAPPGLPAPPLARNFVAAVGTTPMRFLTQRRLSVAKGLTERTTMTLDEIAGRVGYSSAFSLSKAFKQEFQHSPSAFRPALAAGPS